MRRTVSFLISMLMIAAWVSAQTPQTRPLPPKDAYVLSPDAEISHLVLKFHEGTQVRLRDGGLTPLERSPEDQAQLQGLGLTASQVEADVVTVEELVASRGITVDLRRLFTADEDLLTRLEDEGELRSGRALADLNLYFGIEVPSESTYSEVEEVVGAFNALDSVEIAYAAPPAQPAMTDIPPTTPDLEGGQGYLGPAPQGIDADYAWTVPGGKGANVKIVDVEGAWNTTHEDLPLLFHQGGTQISLLSWRNHGTAVLGVLAAIDNSYGVTGIANQAQVGYESVGPNPTNTSVASAIVDAAVAAGPGGVVLIEVAQIGPANNSPCTCNTTQCDQIPMEYWQASFDAIATATANGTVVVEGGGNGSSDLDDPAYSGLFDRSVRDSGAILVAASLSTARSPICFTNWGRRIDVHSWGENVVTLGEGDHPNFDSDDVGGDEDQFYTASFDGTSSASAIVAGAVGSVQGTAISAGLGARSPAYVRQLLVSTGTPQDSGTKNIGPQPDLQAALDQVLSGNNPPVAVDDFYTTETDNSISILFPELLANDSDPDGDTLRVVSFGPLPSGSYCGINPVGFCFLPDPGFVGTVEIPYTISDGTLEASATIWITVNTPPVAVDDHYTMEKNSSLDVLFPTLLGNDYDPDGDTLRVVSFGPPPSGSYCGISPVGFCFLPDLDFVGTVEIPYTISDGIHEDTATIFIEVQGSEIGEIGEVGQVTNLRHIPQTIILSRSYTNPVVFAQPLSYNGSHTSVVRITDVQPDRFTFYVHEAPDQDGAHTQETVAWVVLEAGRWQLADGTLLEVGKLKTAAEVGRGVPNQWATLSFASAFEGAPVVLSQVQSETNPHWVKTRQRNASASSVQLAMEEDDASTTAHGLEDVGWLAIESGVGTWNGQPYEAGLSPDSVTHVMTPIPFNQSFSTAPRVLASMATFDGTDGAALRRGTLTATTVEIKVEEDRTWDSEVGHTTEVVGFLAIEGDGTLTAAPQP